ncbi:MAG: M48 family metallopeptidase [Armatimonadetes bacterium]|nr:M48 family metallopeptidase [Armatimonadota bacterium]
MSRTFDQQIKANKRLSLFYCFLVIVVLAGLGGAVLLYYSPENWLIGMAGAAVLGLIVAIVAWTSGSDIVLKLAKARTATALELQVVENVTEEMAIAAGIPPPKVYIIDDPSPNAFATGRRPERAYVVVTTGLIEILNREELQGVVAHEVAHIRNNDIKLMTTLAIVAGLVPLISHMFLRSMWYGGGRRSRDSGGGVLMIIGIALAILAPLFAMLLKLAVSRKREFMADATAVELTRNPDGLVSALTKLSKPKTKLKVATRATEHMYIINPLKPLQRRRSWFSTHPTLEARVIALKGMAGLSYERQQAMEAAAAQQESAD